MHVPINDSLISNRSVRNSWQQRRSSGADFERKLSIITPLRLASGTKPPCWRAKVALGQDKERKLPFKITYVFSLSVPVRLLLSSMPF